jgi:hypothetical protein
VLLGNYSILNRNTDAMQCNAFTNPMARFKATQFSGFYCGDAVVTDQTSKSAFNNGYAVDAIGGSMWFLSPVAGGLACTSIYGVGTLSADLLLGRALVAALTGSGDISAATLSLIVQLAAALTGSGTISAASLDAITQLAAALSGSGDVTAAALSLLVSLNAGITGSGTLAGGLSGLSDLSADIVVTGTGLTTSAQRCWRASLRLDLTGRSPWRKSCG